MAKKKFDSGDPLIDLKEWRKDPRGTLFWDEIRKMFAKRGGAMRDAVRANDHNQAAIMVGHCDALEEVLQLPEILIDENKGELEPQ